MDFEKTWPNVKTNADLDFSDMVIKLGKNEHYDLVERLMIKRLEDSLFPIERYLGNSFLAFIAKSRGDQESFQKFRELADENATQEESGIRYHQDLGVVKKRDSWLDKLLKRK